MGGIRINRLFTQNRHLSGNLKFFQVDELLSDVEAMLDASPQLRDSVQLRGSLQFEKMEDFFNSADFFIQASLEEYGGNSLVEAMACGAIPVVTNIPSFRYL